jgi:hypothetical protein
MAQEAIGHSDIRAESALTQTVTDKDIHLDAITEAQARL